MLHSLNEFKEQKQTLKSLNIGDDTEQVNLQLIKMQVLDMAERFDAVEDTQRSQSVMLGYVVQALQRMERNNSAVDTSNMNMRDSDEAAFRMTTGDRDYATLFRNQEKGTDFKLSEKQVNDYKLSDKSVIMEVEELDES